MGSSQSSSSQLDRRQSKWKSSHNFRINCTPAHFEGFRQRWKTVITGGEYDMHHPEISDTIQRLSTTAEQHLKNIQAKGSQIWPDLNPIHLSINFRKCYDRLRTLALAYSVNGTSVYQDLRVLQTILQSLDLINAEAYNSSTIVNPNENWWNYKIGASKPLIDISMILHDELGAERRNEYGITMSKMLGDLNSRSLIGSNRANMCQVLIGASILMQDSKEFQRAYDALFDISGSGNNSLFTQVSSGEGFYEDGSYISHRVYPYAGGYGLTHILAVSQLAYVLQNSPFALSSSDMSIIFKSIQESFGPFMFRGMMMGNVRGRDVSRKDENDSYAGNLLVQAVLRLIATAPEPYKAEFKSLVLSWQEEAPFVDMGDSSIVIASGIQRLKQEKNIPAVVHDTGFRIFPMSDRVVFHQQHWTATIAMSSTRIGRYETLNSENLRPFYQGDGFLQVYLDNDREYFLDDYYSTMDPYHTPGVTAGQSTQKLAAYGSTAYNEWAGGVQWRTLGAASLDYLSHDKTVSAKKSWFFLANAILALGISCNGTNGTEIHSTIDARKSMTGVSRLVIDGEATDSSLFSSWKKTYDRSSWAHLDGVGGYHFLDSGNMTFERSTLVGRWSDINQYPDYAGFDELNIQEYTTIYRNHRVDPVGESYAYAMLPNITASATEKLARTSDFFVVANTAELQAVTFHNNKTTMATFWGAGEVGDVKAMTSCQVAWGFSKMEDQNYTVALSDPTQKLYRIEIILQSQNIGTVLFKDLEIRFTEANKGAINIEIDTRNSHGRTYTIIFERRR